MAKFYEIVGFVGTSETSPGVWTNSYTDRYYFGDIIKNYRKYRQDSDVNDDVVLDMTISIIADDFALSNLQTMTYIKWMGSKWKIINVSVERPRIVLTIGGVFNG